MTDEGAMEIMRDQSGQCQGLLNHQIYDSKKFYFYSYVKLSGKLPTGLPVLAFDTDIRPLEPHQTQITSSSSEILSVLLLTFKLILKYLGNYRGYGMQRVLTRSFGPFILSVYLPSHICVVMSWNSFFIPPDIEKYDDFFRNI